MSSEEINLVAALYPKPGKAEEVRTLTVSTARPATHISTNQLSVLLAEVTKKVQANEPDTLLYYAFFVKEKNEVVVVER